MSDAVRVSDIMRVLSILSCEISIKHGKSTSITIPPFNSLLRDQLKILVRWWSDVPENFQFSLARSGVRSVRRLRRHLKVLSILSCEIRDVGGNRRRRRWIYLSILSCEISYLDERTKWFIERPFNSLLRDQIQLKVLYQQLTYRLSILSCEIRGFLMVYE